MATHHSFIGPERFLDIRNCMRAWLPTARRRICLQSRVAGFSVMASKDSLGGGGGETVFATVVEGSATMQYDQKEAVFYNKVQVLNRDLSIQVIRLFAEIREREKAERYQAKLARYQVLLQEAGVSSATSSSSSGSSSSSSSSSSSEAPPTTKSGQPIKAPYELPKGIHILDALAATGLRSVRYLKEIPLVNHVTINDLESVATAQARVNCEQNGVDMDRVTINTGDAVGLMYARRQPLDNFDVIDLDPYGTVSPFLDSAVQAVADGGLLCVTCTDMAVLCGSFPEKCFSLYGAVPLKNGYVHEAALRILLHAIEAAANKHKKHIVPWLSLSVDFYVRVFVRVFEAPAEVKRSLLKRALVVQSVHCPAFFLQPLGSSSATRKSGDDRAASSSGSSSGKDVNYYGGVVEAPSQCPETGSRMRVGGPIWSAPIHSQEVVDTLLQRLQPTNAELFATYASLSSTAPRLLGILTSLSEEMKHTPLYFSLPELCAAVECTSPSNLDVHAALQNAGYCYSQFHHDPGAIKTDAPASFIFDMMRAWCKLHPPEGSKHKKQSSSAAAILAKPLTHTVSFLVSDTLKAEHERKRKEAVARFPPNPEDHWGPKRRADGGGSGGVGGASGAPKVKKNKNSASPAGSDPVR